MAVKVYVEYCGIWGYAPRFKDLQKKILAVVPEAVVNGAVGRESSFEVSINDVEVYSKLKSGSFPNFSKVVQEVKNVSEGKEPSKIKWKCSDLNN